MNQRLTALITGWTIVIMALASAFVFGRAMPHFTLPNETASLMSIIQSERKLYYAMLAGLLFIQFLDLLASYTFFRFFLEDNPQIARFSAALRFVYTLIFIWAGFYLFQNLSTAPLSDAMILSNFKTFHWIWTFGLIIFGVHIFLLGFLMKWHESIHPLLWIMALVAGLSYSLTSILKLIGFNPDILETLELALALPMIFGELALAIWLIAKGGKLSAKKALKASLA